MPSRRLSPRESAPGAPGAGLCEILQIELHAIGVNHKRLLNFDP